MSTITSRLTSTELAELIVDALIDAEFLSKSNLEKAILVAAQEIEVRKALGDYYCGKCINENRKP